MPEQFRPESGNDKEKSKTPETEKTERIEFGPYIGKMTWEEAEAEIARLNSGLGENENHWRLPINDEVRENAESFNPQERGNLLDNQRDYWVGSHKEIAGFIAGPGSTFGGGSDGRIGVKHHVRLVR